MMLRILDLYCGAGGCSKGYELACIELGIEPVITGVDIEPQANYPYNFVRADAIKYLEEHWPLYDYIHASPPCQEYTRAKSLHKGRKYPDLVAPTREALKRTGKPYVIENVPGSPLDSPIVMDGTMFDLRVIRKRLFESNLLIPVPEKGIKKGTVGGKNYRAGSPGYYFIVGGHQSGTVQQWRDAMGIQWMKKKELAQAIPPAYTHWIGKHIFQQLHRENG